MTCGFRHHFCGYVREGNETMFEDSSDPASADDDSNEHVEGFVVHYASDCETGLFNHCYVSFIFRILQLVCKLPYTSLRINEVYHAHRNDTK